MTGTRIIVSVDPQEASKQFGDENKALAIKDRLPQTIKCNYKAVMSFPHRAGRVCVGVGPGPVVVVGCAVWRGLGPGLSPFGQLGKVFRGG